ncbi:ATP-grasp domain-containing protein [Dictyobacter arantiisoli]|uniref:ATP-grasp domain-containing protein n=1 Tax=Dictyobacter arantiisoli TaxID=2014874 RepID=A0A5A5TDH9_9CHLR|nr:hypothetical protein [Dictyobacter arantiisoli]GCF09417.1 hypothetical protein KDI_29810 [Dictyobacter arantiisoli]
MKLFIATDPEHLQRGIPLEEDDKLLQMACWQRDIHAQVFAWNDPLVHWEEADAILIRSTWRYHHALSEFLVWVQKVAQTRSLWNPAEVIRWNSHKGYLQELAQAGFKTIPTVWFKQGTAVDIDQTLAKIFTHWKHIVIKPTTSSNAHATVLTDDPAIARQHLEDILHQRDAMIQPYLQIVQEEGEHSLIFIEGNYAHAFRKKASLALDPIGEVPIEASEEEKETACALLAHVAQRFALRIEDLLFARVDLIRIGQDFCIMELELIEPRLRLDIHHYQALNRLAQSIEERLNHLRQSSHLNEIRNNSQEREALRRREEKQVVMLNNR